MDMGRFDKGVAFSQASTSYQSSWGCSQTGFPDVSSTALCSWPEETHPEWAIGGWTQKEMVPAVAQLLYLCEGLWDHNEANVGSLLHGGGAAATQQPVTRSHATTSSMEPSGSPHATRVSTLFFSEPAPASSLGSNADDLHVDPVEKRSTVVGFPKEGDADAHVEYSMQQRWKLTPFADAEFAYASFHGRDGNLLAPASHDGGCMPPAQFGVEGFLDSDDEAMFDDDDVDVLVGPTQHAMKPMRLDDQTLPQKCCNGEVLHVPFNSGPRCMSLGDALRLSDAGAGQAPLSFGSVLHLNFGGKLPCRPCMFERWAGRCIKSWLCDFCHVDASDRNHGENRTLKGKKRSSDDQWCLFGNRPKSL